MFEGTEVRELRLTTILYCGCIALAPCLIGQGLPGCEARPEVTQTIHDQLGEQQLAKLKWAAQQTVKDRILGQLTAKYPREVEPHLWMIRDARWRTPERLAGLQQRYREMAAAHPDDPLALSLAATALYGTDTTESIRLAEAVRAMAPQFAYPTLFLAQVYGPGLRADRTKFEQNVRAYFALCPASGRNQAHYMLAKLGGDAALQGSIATALRKRLSAETNPAWLDAYSTLWGLEFRVTPPASHDALRKQVAADVKRLESLNPKPDSDYLELLLKGFKQSGASKEMLTTFENKMLSEAPGSTVAFIITQDRWKKDNPEPESQTDLAAWQAYNAKLLAITGEWQRKFPDVTWLAGRRVNLLFDDDSVIEKDGVAALEVQLLHEREFEQPMATRLINQAWLLLNRKWQPDRALALLNEARPLLAADEKSELGSDNLTPEEREQQLRYLEYPKFSLNGGILKAAMLMGKPEVAEAARAQVEAALAKDAKKGQESRYWHNRARLASIDKHPADALAYFQHALQIRSEAENAYHGKIDDDLTDEARDLWKALGGTETAWTQWSKPPVARGEEQKQGRWEKPKKDLPAFELSDLSGKTWRLKTLEGKTVMINLWATWCGPCKAELPQFQKLYEKVKGRTDVQVITFNIDDELGLVAPFMKENGYSFPVLLAYDFTFKLLEGIGIPQNWIVDAQGKWRWTQIGFGSEPDWPGEMLKRLESEKAQPR